MPDLCLGKVNTTSKYYFSFLSTKIFIKKIIINDFSYELL